MFSLPIVILFLVLSVLTQKFYKYVLERHRKSQI
jgi:hypothetical protein